MKFDNQKLENYLDQAGLKQIDFAKKMRSSYKYVNYVIRGARNPSVKLVTKMARFFGISAKDFYKE